VNDASPRGRKHPERKQAWRLPRTSESIKDRDCRQRNKSKNLQAITMTAFRVSLLSAFAGWCTGMLYCCSVTLWFIGLIEEDSHLSLDWGSYDRYSTERMADCVTAACRGGSKRVLSVEQTCSTPLGGLAGLSIAAAILFLNALSNESAWPPEMYDWRVNFINNLGTFGPPSVLVGLVTCLAGAFLHRGPVLTSSPDTLIKNQNP
jgi:hypothetical protein